MRGQRNQHPTRLRLKYVQQRERFGCGRADDQGIVRACLLFAWVCGPVLFILQQWLTFATRHSCDLLLSAPRWWPSGPCCLRFVQCFRFLLARDSHSHDTSWCVLNPNLWIPDCAAERTLLVHTHHLHPRTTPCSSQGGDQKQGKPHRTPLTAYSKDEIPSLVFVTCALSF